MTRIHKFPSVVLLLLAAVAATTALALAPPSSADESPSQDIVAGSGKVTFPDFPTPGESTTEQFIVSAHSGALGEDPHGQMTFHSPLLVSQQAKAEVTCMTVTSNRARIGGIYEEPVIYAPSTFDGPFRWFELIVEDNGPPGGASDRLTALIFFDNRPPDFNPCDVDSPELFQVVEGNFTVNDATP
jgi:hypothetical protein